MEKKYDPKIEEPKIQKMWEKLGIFKYDPKSKNPIYSIDTPPPTISGFLHVGHAYSYSQMEFVARYPSVVAHSVNIDLSGYECSGQTSFSHCRFSPPRKEGIIQKPFVHHLQYRTTMMPPAVICRKDIAMNIGLFDESLSICEDYDFMCRLALQGNWGYSDNILVIAHKRDETTKKLSAARGMNRIITCMSLIKTHSKLLSEQCLSKSERRIVSKLLSNNYRTLGQLLSKKDSYKESREAFRKAYNIHLSFKSFLWYIFSRLPGSIVKNTVNFRGI